MNLRHQLISMLFAVTAVFLLVTCVSTLTVGGEQASPVSEAEWDASAKLFKDVPDWREWKPSPVKKSETLRK
jgi:hypothetical protein